MLILIYVVSPDVSVVGHKGRHFKVRNARLDLYSTGTRFTHACGVVFMLDKLLSVGYRSCSEEVIVDSTRR